MGVYVDRVLPRIIDKALATEDVMAWRRRCVEGLAGVVVEPGFGSGLNVEVYPAAVTKVYAVDPAELGRRLAADRVASSAVEVEHVGLDGQSLPLADASCDAGLLTFTLCTIPDADLALRELHRVIKPGGALHFIEHGHAPDAGVQKWQRRLEPLQKRLFDGCHLTRDMPALIARGGFEIEHLETDYAPGPKPLTWYSLGRARRA